MNFDEKNFRAIAELPLVSRNEWLPAAELSLDFMRRNVAGDEIAIYATGPCALIIGHLAPASNVMTADSSDCRNLFNGSSYKWKIQKSFSSDGYKVYLEPPYGEDTSALLRGGEPLVHRRRFEGVDKSEGTVEISQKLVHCLDLYFVPESNAYCRLDAHGDIEEVIRIRWLSFGSDKSLLVTMRKEDLFSYMALSNTALVLAFDFTRVDHKNFPGWGDHERFNVEDAGAIYHGGTASYGSYINGCLLVHSSISVAELEQRWRLEFDGGEQEYATFKIYDRKNDCNTETSCGPDGVVSYFVKSQLPWEVSPAFFRAEVLHRFKADSEKFTLEDRSIYCRGAWYLKSYDINEAGQVHVYMCDLAMLPIGEQRYWQSFNEWPKGPISKRAFENDILGAWTTEFDPLRSIKNQVEQLDANPPGWWKPRGEEVIEAARYPVTDSVVEWGNEIMALDQMLIEGFLSTGLKKVLKANGQDVDKEPWQSIRLLQEWLALGGVNAAVAANLVEPLKRLHGMRSTLKGHAAINARDQAASDARKKYGSLRAQFREMVTECESALVHILGTLPR